MKKITSSFFIGLIVAALIVFLIGIDIKAVRHNNFSGLMALDKKHDSVKTTPISDIQILSLIDKRIRKIENSIDVLKKKETESKFSKTDNITQKFISGGDSDKSTLNKISDAFKAYGKDENDKNELIIKPLSKKSQVKLVPLQPIQTKAVFNQSYDDSLTNSSNTSLTDSPITSLTDSPITSLTNSSNTSLTDSPITSLTDSVNPLLPEEDTLSPNKSKSKNSPLEDPSKVNQGYLSELLDKFHQELLKLAFRKESSKPRINFEKLSKDKRFPPKDKKDLLNITKDYFQGEVIDLSPSKSAKDDTKSVQSDTKSVKGDTKLAKDDTKSVKGDTKSVQSDMKTLKYDTKSEQRDTQHKPIIDNTYINSSSQSELSGIDATKNPFDNIPNLTDFSDESFKNFKDFHPLFFDEKKNIPEYIKYEEENKKKESSLPVVDLVKTIPVNIENKEKSNVENIKPANIDNFKIPVSKNNVLITAINNATLDNENLSSDKKSLKPTPSKEDNQNKFNTKQYEDKENSIISKDSDKKTVEESLLPDIVITDKNMLNLPVDINFKEMDNKINKIYDEYVEPDYQEIPTPVKDIKKSVPKKSGKTDTHKKHSSKTFLRKLKEEIKKKAKLPSSRSANKKSENISKDLGNISQDLGSNSKDLGSNSKDLGNINKDLGSNSKDLGNINKDLGNINKDLGSNSKDLGNINKNLGNINKDLGSNSKDLGNINKDLGNINPDNNDSMFLPDEVVNTEFKPVSEKLDLADNKNLEHTVLEV